MHTIRILLCFVMVFITDQFYPHPLGLIHWHGGDHDTVSPVLVKRPQRIWVNESHASSENCNMTKAKQTTTNYMGHTVQETTLKCNGNVFRFYRIYIYIYWKYERTRNKISKKRTFQIRNECTSYEKYTTKLSTCHDRWAMLATCCKNT